MPTLPKIFRHVTQNTLNSQNKQFGVSMSPLIAKIKSLLVQSNMVWEEIIFEELQHDRDRGHLGYQNGNILAIVSLHVVLMHVPRFSSTLHRIQEICFRNFKIAAWNGGYLGYTISIRVQCHADVSKQAMLLDGLDVSPLKRRVCGCGLNRFVHEGMNNISNVKVHSKTRS